MQERDFLIAFERQLILILPTFEVKDKLTSDTIFFYLNKAKDYYIRDLYRLFLQNQEVSDKLRTIVTTKVYTTEDFVVDNNRWTTDYPEDYVFALGEKVTIDIVNNQCPNILIKSSDVIEATIESVDRILENSLSEYHLKYNLAKPVRVYTDNKIILYTDGLYNISLYELTYLKPTKRLGDNLSSEYTDLPDSTHKEIIDVAVQMFIQHKALANQDNSNE